MSVHGVINRPWGDQALMRVRICAPLSWVIAALITVIGDRVDG
jgi:hypothetical protein